MELLPTLVEKYGLFALIPVIAFGLLGLSSVLGIVTLVLRPSWAGRRMRWLGSRSLLLCVLLVGLVLAANALLFEPIVRVIIGRVEASSQVTIDFESAEGSLWTGEVLLRGARFVQAEHPAATFDLALEAAELDLSLLGLLGEPVRIESVSLRGVRGAYHRFGEAEALPPDGAFVLERLRIEDAVLRVRDETLPGGLSGLVTVESLGCDDLRRDMALFDLLFRAMVSGRFNGQPFTHVTQQQDGFQTSHWHIEGVPLVLLGGDTALIESLGAGLVDLEVDSRWDPSTERMLDLAWQLRLGDLGPSLPWLSVGGVIGDALDWLRDQEGLALTVPLRFEIARFERARTFAQTGLLADFGPALARSLLDRVPLPGIGGDLLDQPLFENLLDVGDRVRVEGR